MKRRTFLAAMAPMIAAIAPASGQSPLGTAAPADPTGTGSGRLRVAGAPTSAAAPSPVAPAVAPEPKKPKGPTEITSRAATLDNRKHLATFGGEVEVKDPEYILTCDKLTVHLKKPPAKGAAKPAPGPKPVGAGEQEPAAKPAEKAPSAGGGIERAIAEGNVTITQDKVDAEGRKQRYFGKARRAVFDPDKKTCVLSGWPSISQSLDDNMGKEVMATQESTVITLDQAGEIKVDGPNKVRLNDVDSLQQNPGGGR